MGAVRGGGNGRHIGDWDPVRDGWGLSMQMHPPVIVAEAFPEFRNEMRQVLLACYQHHQLRGGAGGECGRESGKSGVQGAEIEKCDFIRHQIVNYKEKSNARSWKYGSHPISIHDQINF